jgi:UDP-glucose:(heptosyl)LPS alpha-1,3-glucosyltransferase
LQKRIIELGLTDTVIFAGTTTDLQSYYNAADIFVLLSDGEAGSIACLEAMSSGLPVIVSKSGGFDEVVKPNCGRTIDTSLQEQFIEAVIELRNSSDLRGSLGANGRQRIIEEFSWGIIAQKLISLLSSNALKQS